LQSIAELMRARARLAGKVRAYSAEARLSARILAVMPLIFVAMVLAANPEVYSDAVRDPLVFPVLLGAGALQVVGILVMRRMAGVQV
jgi:tight adherence protein B